MEKEEQIDEQTCDKVTTLNVNGDISVEGVWMFTIKSFTLLSILKMFVIKSYRQKLWGMSNSWKRSEIVNYIKMNQQRRKKKTAKKLNESPPPKK